MERRPAPPVLDNFDGREHARAGVELPRSSRARGFLRGPRALDDNRVTGTQMRSKFHSDLAASSIEQSRPLIAEVHSADSSRGVPLD